MKSFGFIFSLLTSSLLAADAPQQQASAPKKRTPVLADSLNTTHQLVGPIGKPVGDVVTLSVTVNEKRSKGYFEDFVTVTSVEGTELPQPVMMPARLWTWANIKKLAPGQKLIVRAYQDAGMIGHPAQALRETVSIQTTEHTFVTWLVILNEVRKKP